MIPPGATPVFVTADKKMQYGALTITPGGFIAMESASRTRAEQALASDERLRRHVPTNNSVLAHVGENRFEARQSRPALVDRGADHAELSRLGLRRARLPRRRHDFELSTRPTAYVPRIRHLYATLDNNEYGMHVLAGQEWSLVTMNSKGITPRNEVTPPQIDPSYIPGFEYARLPQIRLTKDFNKKLWLAVSLEQSANREVSTGVAISSAMWAPQSPRTRVRWRTRASPPRALAHRRATSPATLDRAVSART